MVLYRPTGLEELRLIYESRMKRFPPRLPEQPIFYPVLHLSYAQQIARDWNTKSGTRAGYVTTFTVDDEYAARYERRVVGRQGEHEELWVPAEQLDEFNSRILGPISVVSAYFGEGFTGYVPQRFLLKGKNAIEQLVALASLLPNYAMDFYCEVAANHTAVFLHYSFWQQHDSSAMGVTLEQKAKALSAIEMRWSGVFPEVPLPLAPSRG